MKRLIFPLILLLFIGFAACDDEDEPTAPEPEYIAGGLVYNNNDQPVPGVLVMIEEIGGRENDTIETDGEGQWQFTALTSKYEYVITPISPQYSYQPDNYRIVKPERDNENLVFYASPAGGAD